MRIYADTPEKQVFFQELQKAPKTTRTIKTVTKTGGQARSLTFVSFDFNGKKITDFTELAQYLETIENRYQIAKLVTLPNIQKECETKKITSEEARKKWKELEGEISVPAELVINSEYFLFAIKSSIDTMTHVLNIFYGLNLPKEKVGIWNVIVALKQKSDGFTKKLEKHYDEWIRELSRIRNHMTHHRIVTFSSVIHNDLQKNEITWNKRAISIEQEGQKIEKNLPEYFEQTLQKYEALSKDFYALLNTAKFQSANTSQTGQISSP